MKKVLLQIVVALFTVTFIAKIGHGKICKTRTYSPKAVKLYVSKNGNDSFTGSKKKPFKTIQKAINASRAHTIIYVGKGFFKEFLNIDNKSITLIGKGENQTFICGTSRIKTLLSITHSSVRITHLTLTGSINKLGNTLTIQGIHSRYSSLYLENVTLGNITFAYISLWKSNFHIRATKLKASMHPNATLHSDLGINIGDSEGIIDGIWADQNIDHAVNLTSKFFQLQNGKTVLIKTTESPSLIIQNSHFIGRENILYKGKYFDWGDCIRIYGAGTNEITIRNNTFIGPDTTKKRLSEKLKENRIDNPVAMHLGFAKFKISGNKIVGFRNGIFFGIGSTKAKIENNTFEHCGIGVKTLCGELPPEKPIYDFGGGPLKSHGQNIFRKNYFYDIANCSSEKMYAIGNIWNSKSNNEKSYNQQTSKAIGKVITN